MKERNATIASNCPRFACKICRTKTGWAHQIWCPALPITLPECGDCMYHNEKRETCEHPNVKGKERASD